MSSQHNEFPDFSLGVKAVSGRATVDRLDLLAYCVGQISLLFISITLSLLISVI